MKKTLLLFNFVFLTHLFLFSQDTYIRPAVSVVNIDYTNSKSILDINSVVFPKNLDQMSLSIKKFNVNSKAPKILYASELDGLSTKEMIKALKGEKKEVKIERDKAILSAFENNKLANAAILSVVPIVNGEYDYSSILERGINSATDQDVNLTSQNMSSETMSEEDRYLDIATKVLNKNYVVAINMSNPKSFSDENSSGFEGHASYYVFKIENIYSDGDLTIKAEQLPNSTLKSEIVDYGTVKHTASNSNNVKQKRSSQELKNEINIFLLSGIWDAAKRNVEGFQPRTTLLAKRKISLGTKEDLKIDNRFFVYQNEENRKGEIIKKKKATMRVKKVAKNDGKATGDSEKSKLYKIGYGKASKGMLVQQKEDIGVGISLGYGDYSWMRFDFRLKGITPGLLLFIDLHPYPGKVEFNQNKFLSQGTAGYLVDLYSTLGAFGYDVEVGDFSAFALNGYLGAEKQIRLGSALYLSPFIAGGYSTISLTGDILDINNGEEKFSWSDESEMYYSILANAGARVGLQLGSSLSLNFTASYLLPVVGGWADPVFVDESGAEYYNLGLYSEVTDQDVLEDYYNDVIKEMPSIPNGIQTTIMLRYEF